MPFPQCSCFLLMMALYLSSAAEDGCSPAVTTYINFTDWLVVSNSWSTANEPDATSRCLTVLNATLLPPSVQSWGQPDFSTLSPSPVDSGQPLPIILHHTTFQTDCSTVQHYQQYICLSDTMLLAGLVQMTSPFWVYVKSWSSPTVISQSVNITCVPPSHNAASSSTLALGNTTEWPACLVTSVRSASGLLAAINYLQRVQGPPPQQLVPVLIVLEQDIKFTTALVAPFWSYGMPITGNITVTTIQDNVVMDWGNLVNVLNVNPNPEAYLTISRLIMINLPVWFAPPANNRFHISGVLQSVVWPIYRKATGPAQVMVKSVVQVMAYDSFSLWAYFFSLARSPDPAVAKLASWTTIRGINTNTAVGNTLRVTNANSPTVIGINVTIANPDFYPVAIDNVGVLSIANNIVVPPTAMFQVASLAQIQFGINYTINNTWTTQFGQFIIICRNITGNIVNAPVLPPQGNATISYDFPGATVLPPPPPAAFIPLAVNLTLPAVLQAPTTFTTWPNASACWDFQLIKTGLLVHGPQTKVTMRQLSLMNLPPDASAESPGADPHMSLVSGFWLFNVNMGDSAVMSTYLTLQEITLYVPPPELQLYFSVASFQRPNASSDDLQPSATGKQLMVQWIKRQQIMSSGAQWIFYKSLETSRFQGTNVNLTDVVPPLCSKYAARPLTVSYTAYTTDPASTSLPGWAIGLIAGLGGAAVLAMLGALWILMARRRRCVQRQRKQGADGAHKRSSRSSGSGWRLVGAPSEMSAATLPSATTQGNAPSSQLSGSSAAHMLVDSFSNVFRSTMVDGAKQTRTESSDPKSIFTQLALQNSGLKDEQLLISGVLGRGGHGVVYKGMWKSLPVAVKVMIVHEEEHEKARRQMLEAMLSTSLSHPNIVTTYTYDLRRLTTMSSLTAQGTALDSSSGNLSRDEDSFGATAWQLLIVQELCSGGTLRKLIDKHALSDTGRSHAGPPAPLVTHVLQLALDVACGMEHLHTKNVIHSDLNPNNVLMQAAASPRADGLRWTAKVADFGLSETFEAGRSHVSQRFAGTPFYIAPETQSAGIVSKQSDVFAFGILLAEMMSGPTSNPAHDLPPPLLPDEPCVREPSAHEPLPPAVLITCASSSQPQVMLQPDAVDSWPGSSLRDSPGSCQPLARLHSQAFSDVKIDIGTGAWRQGASASALGVTGSELDVLQQGVCDGGGQGRAAAQVILRASSADGAVVSGDLATGGAAHGGRSSPTLPPPPPTGTNQPYFLGPHGASHGHPVVAGAAPTSNSVFDSPRLFGGGGGKFGAARVLPSLPSGCPADYAALVAECLDPVSHQRPPIATVVRRLKALVREHAGDALAAEDSSGMSGRALSNGSTLSTLRE